MDEKEARRQADLADWLQSPHTAKLREQAHAQRLARLDQLIKTCCGSPDPNVRAAWVRYTDAVELVNAMDNGKIG